jgi:hypothetical protein
MTRPLWITSLVTLCAASMTLAQPPAHTPYSTVAAQAPNSATPQPQPEYLPAPKTLPPISETTPPPTAVTTWPGQPGGHPGLGDPSGPPVVTGDMIGPGDGGCATCGAHRHCDLHTIWDWLTYREPRCPDCKSCHAEPRCRAGFYEFFLPCAGGHPPRLEGCATCTGGGCAH